MKQEVWYNKKMKISSSHVVCAILLGVFGILVAGPEVGIIILFLTLSVPFGETTKQ